MLTRMLQEHTYSYSSLYGHVRNTPITKVLLHPFKNTNNKCNVIHFTQLIVFIFYYSGVSKAQGKPYSTKTCVILIFYNQNSSTIPL